MILFWKMANLLLVVQLYQATDVLSVVERGPIFDKARAYQQAAVTTLVTIVWRIVGVSALGEFKLANSVQPKMHFISHHANTALVVLALSKAIAHTIDLHTSGIEQDDIDSPEWISSMKPLVTCILTLDSSASGALMQQYGDILMYS